MLQWFLRFSEFPEFTEFNESYAPFRENSNMSFQIFVKGVMVELTRNKWMTPFHMITSIQELGWISVFGTDANQPITVIWLG